MGAEDQGGLRRVTESASVGTQPDRDELEVTLVGPGYGESVVLHIGDGNWVIVDSCIDRDGYPRALGYLRSLGVDPSQAVGLVVATHWHDDHIRGMSRVVEVCKEAVFCCAAALRDKEFLTAVGAWGRRDVAIDGSGVREIHAVLTQLQSRAAQPTFALANMRIYSRGRCRVWSLSPGSAEFSNSLRSIGALFPNAGSTKTRVPSVSPNDVAVVLWISVGGTELLLGSDSEKGAWVEILQSRERPSGRASVFKVPHHGSENADEAGVWRTMLEPNPYAVLTPWCKGGRVLPTKRDVDRILNQTPNAFATSKAGLAKQSGKRRDRTVDRTIRESKVRLRQQPILTGSVRLRRRIDSDSGWNVERFGPACHLRDFAA